MYVLGIDPGLSTTGYGVIAVERGGLRPVAAGAIRTDASAPIEARLLELHRDLTELIREHAPSTGAIEQLFANRNRMTVSGVGRASGVAILAMGQAGVSVAEYTPSAVKAAVAGDGKADKGQVQEMVARRLRLIEAPRPADAADALAVAICHAQAVGLRTRIEAAR